MLVLSRKIGERILIGENIVITVADVNRGKVRIGISAPREVRIVRGELLKTASAPLSDPSNEAVSSEPAQNDRRDGSVPDIILDNLAPGQFNHMKHAQPFSRFAMVWEI